MPRQGQVRGRINIDTENVGANEKLFNHGDTAGTAKSKKRKSFLSLLFAVPAVSPWLTAFSIGSLHISLNRTLDASWRAPCLVVFADLFKTEMAGARQASPFRAGKDRADGVVCHSVVL
ncbi:hypothetical protein FACS1894158_04000 [Betaproteobacteria bacterium]|nr:hypothetical protein FACS1894158_04000 [Betaproteobacteria bacterium]